jgi:hypothetical protein
MYAGIPASLIMDVMKMEGYLGNDTLELPGAPAIVYIKEEYLCSINLQTDIIDGRTGNSNKVLSSIDHPSFTATREWLGKAGYIKIQRNWCNGDIVLEPFYLNDVLFERDDQFPCAGAMKGHLKYANEYSN